jgi:hypothetical protein
MKNNGNLEQQCRIYGGFLKYFIDIVSFAMDLLG